MTFNDHGIMVISMCYKTIQKNHLDCAAMASRATTGTTPEKVRKRSDVAPQKLQPHDIEV